MASISSPVTLNSSTPSLLFSVVDGPTYIANAYTRTGNPNVFKAGDGNAPLPILVAFPSTPNIYIGPAGVTNTGAGIGFLVPASFVFSYNVLGGDILYAIAASSTPTVQVMAMRQ